MNQENGCLKNPIRYEKREMNRHLRQALRYGLKRAKTFRHKNQFYAQLLKWSLSEQDLNYLADVHECLANYT